ncbi:c-type cytochrome [Desulfuromonas versatilis]|uniref:C-type cytochrome n=1 Tax=Desulfuromonas versatilis TaxID=2802975 RepID=A0ABM8HYF2_9BACT|nr:hypothetical protein [Desulfuromonas versatilis]BCR05570.1 c-type cytochrome [Desulfuromonas versatilis]
MSKMAKKIILGIVTLLVAAGAAHALGPQKVANTPHNLSSNPPDPWYQYESNESQICIFCHTPHGGTLDGPLWNKDLTDPAFAGTPFTHYSSATLQAAGVADANRAVNKESLLCLACHDGSISVYEIINVNRLNPTGTPENESGMIADGLIVSMGSSPGPKVGDSRNDSGTLNGFTHDLSDDHPISLSYTLVQGNLTDTQLNDVTYVEGLPGDRPRFFGGDKRVECASCHDPHVDYDAFGAGTGDNQYTPFLVMSNANSQMCLACHVK